MRDVIETAVGHGPSTEPTSADRYDELYARFRWNVPQRYNIAHAC